MFSVSGVNQKERVNINLNKETCDSSNVEDEEVPEINRAEFVKPSKESCDRRKEHVAPDGYGDAVLRSENIGDCQNNGESEKNGRAWRGDFVKKDQIFKSKGVLKATMEILAMKNNFDYTVFKSTRKWWYIRCKDAFFNWTMRAEGIDGSTYFMINQCEGRHSCAPSKKRKFEKTASTRTIGSLIQHRFDDANDGPKANDIIQFMRLEHSCMEVHGFTDALYTTAAWRTAYAECINPIAVLGSEWNVPAEVKLAKVLPPKTRKSAGRPIKRRYESVEDKIKSSQRSRKNKKHKCSVVEPKDTRKEHAIYPI
ncbi:hypothetical protein DY000_02053161 [Brassica cretica]|uniref:Transposase MuDR plant domain-containing protein n=1 Tax=Brassica cretica TaxID=69181 RepID=A0ABQ7AD35_BRACR|nr:hypothetical protein DY000_02053161 [Brassica cretica]